MNPVLLNRNWQRTAPWAAEWRPGTKNFSDGEIGFYNQEINKLLRSVGNHKSVAFIVHTQELQWGPERRRDRFFEIWYCLDDNPDLMAPVVKLKNPDGSPRPLDTRVIETTLALSPFARINQEQTFRDWMEKTEAQRQKQLAEKNEEETELAIEEMRRVTSADPSDPKRREWEKQHGGSKSFPVEGALTSGDASKDKASDKTSDKAEDKNKDKAQPPNDPKVDEGKGGSKKNAGKAG